MTDSPATTYRLRPMLPDDADDLAAIFRASIEGLTGDDYDADQQRAWLSTVDDASVLAERLADELTLVATSGGVPVGFASLKGADEIDFLYVDPDHARRGVARMLVGALEKLAAARSAEKLTAAASDTARDFFASLGYVAESRNTVFLDGVWLSNTTMAKRLADGTSLAFNRGHDKSGPLSAED